MADRKRRIFTDDYSFPAYLEKIWLQSFSHLKQQTNVRYLEIGTYEGRSLLWVWDHILPQDSCHIDVVDCFGGEAYRKNFHFNVDELLKKNIISVIEGHSENHLKHLIKHSYDLIYVDGEHLYKNVWNDAVSAWPLLKSNGFMVFDDYVWKKYERSVSERPEKAIDDFLYKTKNCHKLIYKNLQVIVQKMAELPTDVALIHDHSPQIPKQKWLWPEFSRGFLQRMHYGKCRVHGSLFVKFKKHDHVAQLDRAAVS